MGIGNTAQTFKKCTQGEGSETQYDILISFPLEEPDTSRTEQVRQKIHFAVISTGLVAKSQICAFPHLPLLFLGRFLKSWEREQGRHSGNHGIREDSKQALQQAYCSPAQPGDLYQLPFYHQCKPGKQFRPWPHCCSKCSNFLFGIGLDIFLNLLFLTALKQMYVSFVSAC